MTSGTMVLKLHVGPDHIDDIGKCDISLNIVYSTAEHRLDKLSTQYLERLPKLLLS